MKLTIYHGHEKPMTAVGKNQCNLLAFAEKYRGWHSFNNKDRATKKAIKALSDKGFIEVIADQFKFKGN